MGISAVVTPDDLKKGEPIKPGWYPAEIISYDEAVTKGSDAKPSDGSLNAIYEFEILDGEANSKGKKFKRYFNEKAFGFGKNLWAVLFPGVWNMKTGGTLTSDMLSSKRGTKLMVYVARDKKTNYDTIEDYRPLSS